MAVSSPRLDRAASEATDLIVQFEDNGFAELSFTPLHGMQISQDADQCEIAFEIKMKGSSASVHIYFNEDYPDSTTLCVGDDEPVVLSANVKEAIDYFESEYAGRFSNGGVGSEIMDETNNEDDIFDYESEPEDDYMNPYLLRDVEATNSILGDFRVQVINTLNVDMCEISMEFPVSHLDKTMLSAWNFTTDCPIIVQLTEVSRNHYRRTTVKPGVKVFQKGLPDKKVAACKLLSRIIRDSNHSYMNHYWEVKDDLEYNKERGGNFLLHLYLYIHRDRLPTLNEHCVLCDDEHVSKSMPMLTVCNKEICLFSVEEMEVDSDLVMYSTPPEVVDLLMHFLQSATFMKPQYLPTTLTPAPSVRLPKDKLAEAREKGESELEIDAAKLYETSVDEKSNTHLTQLRSLVTSVPCMNYVNKFSSLRQLRQKVEQPSKLISWTVASNRSYLVKLTKAQNIAQMNTSHQYLILMDSPAKEASFSTALGNGDSIFVFHGSPLYNWHAIVRNGLKVMSNTPNQLNGAVGGAGIYVSPSPVHSFAYSSMHRASARKSEECGVGTFSCRGDCCKKDPLSLLKTPTYCMAICEVVNSEIKKMDAERWIVANPEHIRTRFLCVYDSRNVTGPTGNSLTADSLLKLQNLIEELRGK